MSNLPSNDYRYVMLSVLQINKIHLVYTTYFLLKHTLFSMRDKNLFLILGSLGTHDVPQATLTLTVIILPSFINTGFIG